MSIIVHRCACGHPDIYHRHPQAVEKGGDCSYGTCLARHHELGAPEVIPTFVDGVLVEFVHEPGGTTSGFSLCACPDCKALYAEVKNDAVPLRAWYIQESA